MGHFFAVLLRNLKREKLYAAINIAGLALGIACCMILGLFLKSELTYDQHYKGYKNIYRATNEFVTNGNGGKYAVTSQALGPMMAAEYPAAIKSYVRFRNNTNDGGIAIRRGDKVFYWEHSYFVDDNVFEVFSHDIIAGDPKTALKDGGSIAISQSVAKAYFGNENPIGQTLTTDSGNANKVTLVFADLPANTHMKYDLLFSYNLPFLQLSDNPSVRRQNLTGIGIYTYFEMYPSFRPSDWERMDRDFMTKYMGDILKSVNATWRSWVQPLKDVHLSTEYQDNRLPNGNRMYLYGCAAVALIILIIACINYMNLATARAARRARSIGIRKILGASRRMLALQFLGEAVMFSLIALVLAAVIVEVVLKFTPINALMSQQVSFDLLHQPMLALWLLGLAVAIGLISGVYPAFYLSSWAPLTALTGKHLAGKGNLRMREFLVLLQFTISATAIASTLLKMSQMNYIANAPLGFEKHNRLVISLRGASTIEKIPSIRNELLRDSHVHGVAVAGQLPGQGSSVNLMQVEGEDGKTAPQQFNNLAVGENYEKVMGLTITQGRDLSSRLLTDVGTNMLVNESFVTKMGWTNPLGKRINQGRVVGVVKDFNYRSLRDKIEPLLILPMGIDMSQVQEINKPFQQRQLILDVSNDNMRGTIDHVRRVITDADPKHPFEFGFIDAKLDELYRAETSLTRLIGIFAAVSIFIACMGLFGLAAFTTEQRTREIGTRKVLGATSWQIVALLARPIMILVLIASVLASVASYFAIDEWLINFAYRTRINPVIFLAALVVAASVAFITVAMQSWKTASADPVNALRHV